MAAKPMREPPREPEYVHINVRLPKDDAVWLRDRAALSYLDTSKEVRRLITAARRAEVGARAA